MTPSRTIQRYTERERMNHWLVAACFLLAALSGLSLFHPSLFALTTIFGGGPWTRILHPFIGLVMFFAFLSMAIRFWSHNVVDADDLAWLARWRDVVANREEGLPAVGRYNAAQKLLFWVLVAAMAALVLSGFAFWRPWFAGYFPIGTVRLAALAHAAAAAVLIGAIIVHIYAAFWVKGSVDAMLRGTVSENWARKHHLAWYREVEKREPSA